MRWWALAASFTLLSPALSAPAYSQPDNKQVLVLYSTRRDAQLSIVGEAEIPRMLVAGYRGHVEYFSEFMDNRMYPEPANSAFRDFLALKYRNARFDLVIAIQDDALAFVTAHRAALFGNSSVVYLTTNPGTARLPNATGLLHKRDLTATVRFIHQLQPDVRQIFAVSGAAATDKAYEAAFRQQMQAVTWEGSVTYLSGLTAGETESRLSRLPARSAVYYLVFTEDGAGQKFHPLEFIDRLTAAANAPTYSWVDSVIGHGVVGGSLYRQAEVIRRIGELGLRVLRGENPDAIPIETVRPNANEVDWRQLQRWQIGEAQIPPLTTVRFRDPSIWNRYGRYVLIALALFITQSLLITGLLIQRKQRRQAEADLRSRESELRRSNSRIRDLGSRLLRAQETERARIAREIHDDISQRMLLLTLELEEIGRRRPSGGPESEALSVARSVSRSLHELSHQLHPTTIRLIGLVSAVERLCVDLSRAGTNIDFSHERVPSGLPPDVMLCIFRIIQEALQNAIKHSKATRISVRLAGGSDGLIATIDDNGVGFDMNAVTGKGVGLPSMEERLDAIDGSLDVRSTPGVGTSVTATIPAFIIARSSAEVERN